jgi:hypothetical protein
MRRCGCPAGLSHQRYESKSACATTGDAVGVGLAEPILASGAMVPLAKRIMARTDINPLIDQEIAVVLSLRTRGHA